MKSQTNFVEVRMSYKTLFQVFYDLEALLEEK